MIHTDCSALHAHAAAPPGAFSSTRASAVPETVLLTCESYNDLYGSYMLLLPSLSQNNIRVKFCAGCFNTESLIRNLLAGALSGAAAAQMLKDLFGLVRIGLVVDQTFQELCHK